MKLRYVVAAAVVAAASVVAPTSVTETAVAASAPVISHPRDDAAVVQVDILSRQDIERLDELGMDIMSVRDGVAEIAAIPSEIDELWSNGYRPRVILSDIRDGVPSLALEDRGEYHSYAELSADLASWASTYSSITELTSIGTSVEGRDIWALKITDNPTVQENEPEIQWIGCHHGNETIGVEVCYYMAKYLLENYGTDPQVTWLVNEREIWIIPMFNPDGHEAGIRYNAEGIDLNRNYLCPCGCNASTAFSAPETQELRGFNVGMNPVTSLTFHSGATYVNYLWDYTYAATPDEPMIITISNGYSSYTGLPVTNGADWYIAHGTCQDWCYDTRGEIDTTIELSSSYEPSASQIDPICNANIQAMLYQARMSGRGISGTVTDGDTGEPLYATISIPEIGKDVYTDPDVGDYHRMVESGTYTVVCNVDGFPTQTVYNVSASLDTFVVVDFEYHIDRGAIAGYVTDKNSDPVPALVEVTDVAGYSAQADPVTGHYEIVNVPTGDHDVRASLPGYSTEETLSVSVSAGETSNADFELEQALFFDDMEAGTSGWSGAWGTTSATCHSQSTSITDSPAGNYPAYATTTLTLQSPIDLSGAEAGTLVFWQKYDTESGYDYCYVDVSVNGGSSWTRLLSESGQLDDWTETALDISDYVGTSGFKVRFTLESDGWVQRDGWYIDDVQIFADQPQSGVGDEAVHNLATVSNFPNPFTPRTTVQYVVPSAGPTSLRIFDVSGRLVRTLVDDRSRDAGRYEIAWDGADDRGAPVAAGIYFAKLAVGDEVATGKLVVLK